MDDKGKLVGILSYLTLLGWIAAIILYQTDEDNQTELAAFHLRQSLGLFLTGAAIYPAIMILMVIPIIGWLLAVLGMPIVGLTLFVFWVIGFIASLNGKQKKVPLLGEFYQDVLSGLG